MTSQNKMKYINAGLLIVLAISPAIWTLIAFTSISIFETDTFTLMLFAVSVSAPQIFVKMLFSYELISFFSPKEKQKNELALLFSLLLTAVTSHGLVLIGVYWGWNCRDLISVALLSELFFFILTVAFFLAGIVRGRYSKVGSSDD